MSMYENVGMTSLDYMEEILRLRKALADVADECSKAYDKIAQLENPWVSVEDRMPDVNQLVLVYADLDNKTAYCTTDYIGQNGTWTGSFYVTHWCYLPKAPRSDTE